MEEETRTDAYANFLRNMHSCGSALSQEEEGDPLGLIFINWTENPTRCSVEVSIMKLDDHGKLARSHFKLSHNYGSEKPPAVTVWYKGPIDASEVPAIISRATPVRDIAEARDVIESKTQKEAQEKYKSLKKNNPLLAILLPEALNLDDEQELGVYTAIAHMAGIVVDPPPRVPGMVVKLPPRPRIR